MFFSTFASLLLFMNYLQQQAGEGTEEHQDA